MSTSTHRLALVPRHGFFVKDGRGWQTSARASVLDWPWPTTVRGALTTVSGKIAEGKARFGPEQWRKNQSEIAIGALVALRRVLPDGAWSRMWPAAADALWLEGEPSVLRLKPKAPMTPTLGRAAPKEGRHGYAKAREALCVAQNVDTKAKPLGPPRWWDDATLLDWLSGRCIKADPGRAPWEQYPRMASRLQVHVGIRPDTLTGDDGILFAHDVIETLERSTPGPGAGKREVAEWAFGAEVTWPVPALPDATRRMARLGSDSRIAWIEPVQDEHLFNIPPLLQKAFASPSQGLRLMVATPACFKGGWLPDGFEPVKAGDTWEFRGGLPNLSGELVLRAAFVPRPMHISGWDMAAGKAKGGAPRGTSRLVPPGAVYFFERAGNQPQPFTADDAKAVWRTGLVVFHDALYVPGSAPGDRPFAVDVLTVHQRSYYGQAEGQTQPGERWPNDYDSPNPVGFISVRPGTRFLLALSGEGGWPALAHDLLTEAIGAWGVGGKTSSDYGHIRA